MRELLVVGCFIHVGDKILIVQRNHSISDGGKWALPSGKVESGESKEQAMIREIKEELDLDVSVSDLILLGEFTWEFPDLKITYPTYRINFNEKPKMMLKDDELIALDWQTADEIYKRDDLIRGFHDLLKYVKYVNTE